MKWRGNPYQFASAGVFDADAAVYITAVETADGQSLETACKDAINAFVVGCKADGIWNAIKACCILAGARTLNGALVPLVGSAPTNVGSFISADYNRKTGLKSDGTKYLNSGRTLGNDPQNSFHLSVNVTTAPTNTGNFPTYIGATNNLIFITGTNLIFRNRTGSNAVASPVTGFLGTSRASSSSYTYRAAGVTQTASFTSLAYNSSFGVMILASGNGPTSATLNSNGGVNFYSIGESLDLSILNSRVSALLSAIADAIP